MIDGFKQLQLLSINEVVKTYYKENKEKLSFLINFEGFFEFLFNFL